MREDFVIGIDPGLTGGISILQIDGTVMHKITMPVIQEQKGKKTLDLKDLADIFEEFKDAKHAYIEKVQAMPKQGVSSMFKFGQGFGALEAMLAAYRIPYTLVHPREWTKQIHKGLSKTIDTKSRSIMAVKRLFPRESLMATPRSIKPHGGIVDSLLIAYWGIKFN